MAIDDDQPGPPPARPPREASWDDVVRDLRRPTASGGGSGGGSGSVRGRHRRAEPAAGPRVEVAVAAPRPGRGGRRRALVWLGVVLAAGAVVAVAARAPQADSAGAPTLASPSPSAAPTAGATEGATATESAGATATAGPVTIASTAASEASSPSPSTPLPATWFDVVARLDAERTRIWTSGRASELGVVDVAGSAAERADRAVIEALRAGGLRPSGLVTEVEDVSVLSKRPGRVTLRVVDRRSAYELRDGDDRVVRRVPARGSKTWNVDVVLVGEHWLVDRTTPA